MAVVVLDRNCVCAFVDLSSGQQKKINVLNSMFQKWRNPGESRITATSEELLGFKSWHSVSQASRGGQGTKFSPWLTEHSLAWDHCASVSPNQMVSYFHPTFLF